MRQETLGRILSVALVAVGGAADCGDPTNDPIDEQVAALCNPVFCNDFNPCTNDFCQFIHCAHSPKPNGTACDDGNACTMPNSCQAGACGAPVVCQAQDPDHAAGTCSPSTGACSNPLCYLPELYDGMALVLDWTASTPVECQAIAQTFIYTWFVVTDAHIGSQPITLNGIPPYKNPNNCSYQLGGNVAIGVGSCLIPFTIGIYTNPI
jgi:hypothetical protein